MLQEMKKEVLEKVDQSKTNKIAESAMPRLKMNSTVFFRRIGGRVQSSQLLEKIKLQQKHRRGRKQMVEHNMSRKDPVDRI